MCITITIFYEIHFGSIFHYTEFHLIPIFTIFIEKISAIFQKRFSTVWSNYITRFQMNSKRSHCLDSRKRSGSISSRSRKNSFWLSPRIGFVFVDSAHLNYFFYLFSAYSEL